MPRTFIVCQPSRLVNGTRVKAIDIAPAEQWGKLSVLLTSNRRVLSVPDTVATLEKQLQGFNDSDYFIPVGDPTVMCIAAIVAASINNGRVKFLRWDKRTSCYNAVQFDINQNQIKELNNV